jgi:hypothetical protein
LPVIDLNVAVGPTWRQFAAGGTSGPLPTTVRTLIDTGSDLLVLSRAESLLLNKREPPISHADP